MLVAFCPRLEAAELAHAIAVKLQHLVGFKVADVDDLIDLI